MLASSPCAVLAIDVGGTTIKAEVTSDSGSVLAAARCQTPKGAQALEAVAGLGTELIARAAAAAGAPAGTFVSGAGVVIPGIVDPAGGTGVYSANIGWRNLAFAGPLRAAWGIPVQVGHDVAAAGWAEHVSGAGQGASDMAFVAIGTGISAALIAGGRLLAGSGSGQPGEVGHVVVRPGGPECGCGNRGCLEALASAAAIARAYQPDGAAPADGARAVFEAAAAGEPRARAVIEQAAIALADGLALLTAITAPERIVLGGGLAEAGTALVGPVAEALGERVRVQRLPSLVTARYGARAGLAGAALLGQSAASGR